MDFTILHFAIHIVWRANVICTCRKSGIARKTTVAYPEFRLLENSQEIVFSGGSDNLSIEVSDDDVLEATISNGKIKIKTKKKGFVFLVVKDNMDNTSVTIRIKVVDRYLTQIGH